MKKNYLVQQETKQLSWLLRIALCMALIGLLGAQHASAQLAGWAYRDGINVQENAGSQNVNYQVLLNINTASLIGAGKMNNKGNDIRFSKDCAGATLLNYFLDTNTINTASTQIWVELDTLKANGNYLMYMWYGNASAPAASNFNNTFPLSTQLIVPAGSVSLTGINNYSWVEVKAGATLTVGPNAPLVINARRIIIDGTINGRAAGELGGGILLSGNGTGGGIGANSGGGGAYGGGGGKGDGNPPPSGGNGGVVYGTTSGQDIAMGSGGGGGNKGNGGNGGGSVTLNAAVLDITGVINLDGDTGLLVSNSGSYAGGGGAGGGLLIKANKAKISGSIYARGGKGGQDPNSLLYYTWGGGGGGGGRIKIFYDNSITNTAVQDVSNGLGGQSVNNAGTVSGLPGAPGTTFQGTFSSGEPTITSIPHVVLSSSAFPICQGASATFTASAGFTPYKFYVDTALKQNSGSATYSTSTLTNGQKVKVLAGDANGCLDTSNVITVTVNPKPTVTVSPATAICIGQSANLTASGGTSYNWAPPTGLSSTTGSAVTASPTLTTTYTVVVTDNNSCQNFDTVTVTVNGCTGFALNSDRTGLEVYPNPSHGQVMLQAYFAGNSQVTITLCSMLGETIRVVETGNVNGSYKKELDLKDIPEGIYFLVLKNGAHTTTKKLIRD